LIHFSIIQPTAPIIINKAKNNIKLLTSLSDSLSDSALSASRRREENPRNSCARLGEIQQAAFCRRSSFSISRGERSNQQSVYFTLDRRTLQLAVSPFNLTKARLGKFEVNLTCTPLPPFKFDGKVLTNACQEAYSTAKTGLPDSRKLSFSFYEPKNFKIFSPWSFSASSEEAISLHGRRDCDDV
jgi:hypothetical protein